MALTPQDLQKERKPFILRQEDEAKLAKEREEYRLAYWEKSIDNWLRKNPNGGKYRFWLFPWSWRPTGCEIMKIKEMYREWEIDHENSLPLIYIEFSIPSMDKLRLKNFVSSIGLLGTKSNEQQTHQR